MRRFNRKQKHDLFMTANGRCVSCGKPLSPGWHGDHVQPWKAGGPTETANGQALCPECNLEKGARMPNNIELRPWQADAESATIAKIADLQAMAKEGVTPRLEDKALVMWLDPGMG